MIETYNNDKKGGVINMRCPFVIKKCTKCGRLLIANEINFSKNKNEKWGLSARCKKCDKKYNKQWRKNNPEYQKQWHKEHKEKVNERHRQHYQDNKEEINERHKQYNKEHKEEISEYNKQYREEHKEEKKEYYKQWAKNNPDKVFNKCQKRRLRENQGNGVTKEQWIEMMEFFDWRCAYSGIVLGDNRTVDHIFPISNGGLNEIWNCVPMLKSYNCSKKTSDMLDWYRQQDFYSEERLNKIYDWIEYAYNKWGVNND